MAKTPTPTPAPPDPIVAELQKLNATAEAIRVLLKDWVSRPPVPPA
jgi:hypothetical protein